MLIPLVLVLGAGWGATGAATAVLVSTAVFCACWIVLFLRVSREPLAVAPPREAVAG